MKTGFKPIVLIESAYIDLSEKLRDELELKIDRLYLQKRFKDYIDNQDARFEDAPKSDVMCAYLLRKAPKEYVLSGRLLQGIKTWYNMYNYDRLSVTDKFRTYYQNVLLQENINENPVITIAFCRFLISELLGILAENRWQNLTRDAAKYTQMLYN